ncbi:hypothetical protein SMC26_21805 [Actinomadura fulvescens]|uniref:Integral membrane protein n=1 Tax=Actinomadura fulvescens TaxID=46160 RepID=A0ABN3QPA4_9ACTN
MSSPIDLPSPAHSHRAAPPRFFGLMKATSVFVAVTMLVQGITAGQLLSNEDGRGLHEVMGSLVTISLLLQIIAAVLVWRVGRGSARYLGFSALLLVLTSLQFAVGTNGNVAVHVPLGVALFGGGAVLVTRVWSAHA